MASRHDATFSSREWTRGNAMSTAAMATKPRGTTKSPICTDRDDGAFVSGGRRSGNRPSHAWNTTRRISVRTPTRTAYAARPVTCDVRLRKFTTVRTTATTSAADTTNVAVGHTRGL